MSKLRLTEKIRRGLFYHDMPARNLAFLNDNCDVGKYSKGHLTVLFCTITVARNKTTSAVKKK